MILQEPAAPPPEPAASRTPRRRVVLAGPALAAGSLGLALAVTAAAGVPLVDPGGVTVRRLLTALAILAGLAVADVAVRAARRSAGRLPSRAALAPVRMERWPLRRAAAAGAALAAFYATYLAYRNLKSVVPLLRPGDNFDAELADADRTLFLGHDPIELLHGLWGVGTATEFFSAVYMLFFLFIPLSLAAALVLLRDLRQGHWYVTALSLNWLLGAGSYFLLPALGPVYVEPAAFADLPSTAATRLQATLLEQRVEFLRDPAGNAQSIGAFASLHTSIFVTAALAAHRLGLARGYRIATWTLLALTVGATMHLGWHYIVDDLAGAAIAVLALALAGLLTGFDPRRARQVPA